MGGGAAMRSAAAKVAGIGVANAGIRGAVIPAAADHPMLQRAGQAIGPAVMTSMAGQSQGAALKPAWELDDWEFAGFEEAEPPARVVFGPAPTLEEAKSATSELKDALEKACLAPSAQTGVVGPCGVPSLSLLSGSDYSETKDCVACNPREAAMLTPSAVQAFKLLSESSAAQVNDGTRNPAPMSVGSWLSVVASIAADPNVWVAVLRNPALHEFVQTHQTTMDSEPEEAVEDVKFQELSDDESVSGKPKKQGNGFMHFFENVKANVVSMANSAFASVQKMFGFSSAENASPASNDSTKAATGVENTLAASFMGLAIMVIMLVVLKRA